MEPAQLGEAPDGTVQRCGAPAPSGSNSREDATGPRPLSCRGSRGHPGADGRAPRGPAPRRLGGARTAAHTERAAHRPGGRSLRWHRRGQDMSLARAGRALGGRQRGSRGEERLPGGWTPPPRLPPSAASQRQVLSPPSRGVVLPSSDSGEGSGQEGQEACPRIPAPQSCPSWTLLGARRAAPASGKGAPGVVAACPPACAGALHTGSPRPPKAPPSTGQGFLPAGLGGNRGPERSRAGPGVSTARGNPSRALHR